MSEPVTNAYKLPSEVISLLGNDATPKKAAQVIQSNADLNQREALEWASLKPAPNTRLFAYAVECSQMAWQSALAAAAIRECEARRLRCPCCDDGYEEEICLCSEQVEKQKELEAVYDAIRNWRQS